MPRPKRDAAREKRITYEIVVDAYDSDERALGWYCYLADELTFPFQARCLRTRAVSPLKKGETVEVLDMAPEDDCMREMIVLAKWQGRKLGLPLSQLEPLKASAKTRGAVGDWHYWVEMGYAF
jgi:hypothetical protein